MYDYVIVGAGSSGCVLANRLSQDGRCRVLLLEAGPKDTNPWLKIPAGLSRVFVHPTLNWGYSTEPEPHLGNRRIYWPRGKTLGGSSAINGMAYVRGHPGTTTNGDNSAMPVGHGRTFFPISSGASEMRAVPVNITAATANSPSPIPHSGILPRKPSCSQPSAPAFLPLTTSTTGVRKASASCNLRSRMACVIQQRRLS